MEIIITEHEILTILNTIVAEKLNKTIFEITGHLEVEISESALTRSKAFSYKAKLND